MILLTGATGHVGLHVARALRGRHDVRALAHSQQSAEVLAGFGLDVVRGNLREPDGLDEAFDGVKRLLLISPPSPGHAQMELAALELAVRGAGLEHVVKLSSIGVQGNEPALLSQPHVLVEEALAGGSFTSTLLRPSSFMTNVMNNASEIRNGEIRMPAGQARIPFVDPRDVADVATFALTQPAPPTGPIVLTGPELLTFGDIAAKLGRALGREVTYIEAEPEAWKAYRVAAGVPAPLVEAIAELYQSLQGDREWGVGDAQQRLLCRRGYSFDEWLDVEGLKLLKDGWRLVE